MKKKRNPVTAKKGKTVLGTYLTPSELARKKGLTEKKQQQLFKSPMGQKGTAAFRKKAKLRKSTLRATKDLHRWQDRSKKALEAVQRAGAGVTLHPYGAAKKDVPSSRNVMKKIKSKSKQLSFFDKENTVAKKKKKHKKSKAKHGKVRRRRRASVRSISTSSKFRKGTVFPFKASKKYRKRRISIAGRIRVNPTVQQLIGVNVTQLLGMAGGAALVPVVNQAVLMAADKLGVRDIVDKVNGALGPSAAGIPFPVIGGVLLNLLAESQYIKSAETKNTLKQVGSGLAVASILYLVGSLSSNYVVPAMHGVLFTPRLNGMGRDPGATAAQMGIYPRLNGMGHDAGATAAQMGIYPRLAGPNGTPPQMGDVRFTPKRMNGISQTPWAVDNGPGYTEAHKIRRADFGRVRTTQGPADFGGADYGTEVVGGMS